MHKTRYNEVFEDCETLTRYYCKGKEARMLAVHAETAKEHLYNERVKYISRLDALIRDNIDDAGEREKFSKIIDLKIERWNQGGQPFLSRPDLSTEKKRSSEKKTSHARLFMQYVDALGGNDSEMIRAWMLSKNKRTLMPETGEKDPSEQMLMSELEKSIPIRGKKELDGLNDTLTAETLFTALIIRKTLTEALSKVDNSEIIPDSRMPKERVSELLTSKKEFGLAIELMLNSEGLGVAQMNAIPHELRRMERAIKDNRSLAEKIVLKIAQDTDSEGARKVVNAESVLKNARLRFLKKHLDGSEGEFQEFLKKLQNSWGVSNSSVKRYEDDGTIDKLTEPILSKYPSIEGIHTVFARRYGAKPKKLISHKFNEDREKELGLMVEAPIKHFSEEMEPSARRTLIMDFAKLSLAKANYLNALSELSKDLKWDVNLKKHIDIIREQMMDSKGWTEGQVEFMLEQVPGKQLKTA